MAGSFRKKLAIARRKLHGNMSVPALYFMPPYDEVLTLVQDCTVRVHDHMQALGDLKGTNFNYAEVEDDSPKIVFLRDEIAPKRGMVISVSNGVAYQVDTVKPPNGITITANVSRMAAKDAVGFPVPEEDEEC
jgi:hypothetical protein